MIRHVVPEGVPAMPAERYVRRAWPMVPGHAVRELFRRRDVKRNGARCGGEESVAGGDELTLYLPDRYAPGPAALIYDDGRLVAAVKPQGLPVDVDQDGIGADTLLTRLRAAYPTAALCHRLDAATGGVVLAALDGETLDRALAAFRAHALRKRYLAMARGGFERAAGAERAWLVKDARRSEVRVLRGEAPGAKPIETRYRVQSEADGIAYAELEPVTGRTHQLRAHMAYLGHPIMGDDKYGDRALNRAHPGPLRLWCAELEFDAEGPMSDYAGQVFAAPPPDWWRE